MQEPLIATIGNIIIHQEIAFCDIKNSITNRKCLYKKTVIPSLNGHNAQSIVPMRLTLLEVVLSLEANINEDLCKMMSLDFFNRSLKDIINDLNVIIQNNKKEPEYTPNKRRKVEKN